jgi:hypothetical protein
MPLFPLHSDPGHTFRFAEDRLIGSFFVPGTPEGAAVVVYRADPATGQPLEALRQARVEAEARVSFEPPLVVRAGTVLVVLPDGRKEGHGQGEAR